jgi:lipopolysaccharide export system permease protein
LQLFQILDRYIIKKIGPPFLVAFFIALFVLMMQILMVYIKSILGKGVSNLELLELVGYLTVSLVPRALPLGILIAMVMVFGSLSEKYELASMKSAGISLQRILRPALIFGFIITAFSYYVSNTVIPITNLKWMTRLHDIRNQKPALSLEEGVFNYDFGGYVVKIDQRNEDTGDLKGVMIYDHRNVREGAVNIISAEKGQMFTTPDQRYLVMQLEDGHQHQELKEERGETNRPTIRSEFTEYTKFFDLSQFELNKTDENRYKSLETMLSTSQLRKGIDSLRLVDQEIQDLMSETVTKFKHLNSKDSTELGVEDTIRAARSQAKNMVNSEDSPLRSRENNKPTPAVQDTFSQLPDSLRASVLMSMPREEWGRILSRAGGIATSRFNTLRSATFKTERLVRSRAKHHYELHTKFSTATMCFIFVLIGAPMGAIIRKGGYGYPLLVSIIFFMLYIVLFIFTGQMSKSLSMNPVLAAWLPNFVLFPIGIFLSYQAAQDSKFDGLQIIASKLKSWLKKR